MGASLDNVLSLLGLKPLGESPTYTHPLMRNEFNTALHPQEEDAFNLWAKQASHIRGHDILQDLDTYDLRGAWKAFSGTPGFDAWVHQKGHLPDTYKKPSHPTFSVESIYHGAPNPNGGKYLGGTWGPNDAFIPPKGTKK